ncbi:hypothetical protein M885DRAFT_622306, partial [Pelagophyceae sp. CCMP2097]
MMNMLRKRWVQARHVDVERQVRHDAARRNGGDQVQALHVQAQHVKAKRRVHRDAAGRRWHEQVQAAHGEAECRDRRYAVMAAAHAVPITLIDDWAHLARKWNEGEMGKRMQNRDENEGMLLLCINDMRRAPTAVAFKGLCDKIYALWVRIGEGKFAAYFFKTYVTAPWEKWYLGASPPGCCSAGQQLIENSHRVDKVMVGKSALKQGPEFFLADTLSKILMNGGRKLDNHPVDEVGHEGGAPMNASNVLEAEVFLSAVPNGKSPFLRLPDDHAGN